jgi:hypothetical protein
MRRPLRPDRDLDRTACRWRAEDVKNRLGDIFGLDHLAPIQMLQQWNHRRVNEARQDHYFF